MLAQRVLSPTEPTSPQPHLDFSVHPVPIRNRQPPPGGSFLLADYRRRNVPTAHLTGWFIQSHITCVETSQGWRSKPLAAKENGFGVIICHPREVGQLTAV